MKPPCSVFRPAPAPDYLGHLRRVTGYRTGRWTEEPVALGEEMAYTRSLVFLLQVHGFHSLRLHRSAEVGTDAFRLLPFTLQSLLETMILPGYRPGPEPTVMKVTLGSEGDETGEGGSPSCLRAEGPYLTVSWRELGEKPVLAENLRQRYAQLTGRPILVREQDSGRIIQIPLLTGEFRYL
ncbi:hypothetical protein [Larkinella soli]|uniref:hypothetical protein n=1 Tax=Larkinella soli TaxID=1770527 RepID=UPI000FFC2981|nr:hypothetical protein [Larkinella soli]